MEPFVLPARNRRMALPRVLIVEDEILVAAELEATLEERGFRSVGIAPDLASALVLAGERPDLALVDINLRDGRTGPVIAERLAREFGVAVLYLTANPPMAFEAAARGVIGVLDKPFEEDRVAAALGFAFGLKFGGARTAPPAGLTLFETGRGSELAV